MKIKPQIQPSRPATGQHRLVRRSPSPLALEQRFMFDGAAVADAVDTVSKPTDAMAGSANLLDIATSEAHALPSTLVAAETRAEQLVSEFLGSPDARQQIYTLFNGGQTGEPSAEWNAAYEQLMSAFRNGDSPVRVELRSAAELQFAKAAFSVEGTIGQATIYLNADWLAGNGGEIAGADSASITTVLVEEIGHYLDATLNHGGDTAGDEGEIFSRFVIDGTNPLSVSCLAGQNDQITLQIDGQNVQAELASFSFVNAYEMVYDLNNDGYIVGADKETAAEKEQSTHNFDIAGLGAAAVNDDTDSSLFSGNDVSAIGINIGGTTYYGWISRPIKSGGVVRGFYFWTDLGNSPGGKPAFTDLATAQADGNTDGDSYAGDNKGFLLVVDQQWFNEQIKTTSKTVATDIDGNANLHTYATVGSSSDRVDSALNSLILPNSPPTPGNDSLTVNEDSGTTTATAVKGLLSNDSDANNDMLAVTAFSVGGVSITVDPASGGTRAIPGAGSVTIYRDGSYSFTPVADFNGPMPPITYTVSDGKGGTSTAVLSISVAPVNDAPQATHDSITTSQNVPRVLTLDDFGTFSDADNDQLTKIRITQPATDGQLQYWNGSAWATVALDQEFSVAQILQGQLRFAPGLDETGDDYATVQFKVFGGQEYSTSAYTLTVNVTAGNQAPVPSADTGTVTEAGCNVAAAPASGNVLTDGAGDSDPEGQTLTVSAVSFDGFTQAVSGETTRKGQYGTLTITPTGGYSYILDNSLTAIDAMNSGDSKTEVFSYTVTDGTNSSTTTLTLTINGTNDAPVAADDFSSLLKGTAAGTGNYGTVTGNALANDSDIDDASNTLAVDLNGSTPPKTPDVELEASSPITSVTLTISQVSGNWVANVPDTRQANVYVVDPNNITQWIQAKDRSGNPLTVIRTGTSSAPQLTFSDQVALYDYQNQNLRIVDPANTKEATVSVAITSASTSADTKIYSNDAVSEIGVGFVVSGTDVNGQPLSGVTVERVDTATKTIMLNKSVQVSNASLTFSDPNSITLASTETYFAGTHGYLVINESGSYTYTLTSNLADDATITEQFTYTVKDPAGCTDTAVITIQVTGTSAPKLANDTLVVKEDSGDAVQFNGSAFTGTPSVSSNDAGSTSITLGDVTSFQVTGDNTSYSAGSTATISGVGTLSIAADGSVTFNPEDDYLDPVSTVTYTRTGTNTSDSTTAYYTANLTISIQAVDDASALYTDSNTVTEGATAAGNVLANDSDVDSTLTVASFSFTSNGATVSHAAGATAQEIRDASNKLIGTLAIESNGNYRFIPAADWNGDVPQITYTTSTGASSTLDITVTPVNKPPTLDLDGNNSSTATGSDFRQTYSNGTTGVAIADTDPAIADIDNSTIASARVVLLNPQTGDALTVGDLPSGITATTTASGGIITVSLSGPASLADYQTAVGAISFSSSGSSTLDRAVSVKVNDGEHDSNTAYTTITVSPDSRAVTVMGTVVNEASPYVMFEVTGAGNQWISLALTETSNADGNASDGTDFLPNLQYYNGVEWIDYRGGLIQIPDTNSGKLLVRTAVLQDSTFETTAAGYETLKLTACNAAGTANVTSNAGNVQADGTAQIRDDSLGSIFLETNLSLTGDTGGTGFPTYLDDDRSVSVDSIVVNEASPWAMFTISGHAGQQLSLALHEGTATAGDGIPDDGSEDYSPSLEYWNGTTWTTYTGPSVTLSGSTLLVRTAIHQDTLFEGQHSFSLGVTKLSAGTTVYGLANIYDDGTGVKYVFDNVNDGTPAITEGPNDGFDDDRALSVDSPKVNEASDYVVFTLTGNSGQTVTLALIEESGTGKADIDQTQILQIWDGLAWVDYDATNLPTFDANGKILVRIDITDEQDDPLENSETFKLNATLSGQTTIVTGTATIVDDGTGTIFTGLITGNAPAVDADGPFDDDMPVNQPPSSADKTVSTNEDTACTFSASDFAFSDADAADTLKAIEILAAPAKGTLTFDGVALDFSSGAVTVLAADISKLSYTPVADENGSNYTTFDFKVMDQSDAKSAAETITIDVTAVNDETFIAGDASGAVTEDLNVTDGNLTDSGTLTISDADSGQASFLTGASDIVAAEGTLGSLAITADGVWTYSVANSAVQYLAEGETKDETFTVQAIDGTSHDVVVTITGVNDAAVIAGNASGAVTEDATTPNLTDTGTLTLSDVDSGQASFLTGASDIVAAEGTLGSLAITADGVWTYSVANADVQYLAKDETRTETFTVKTVDGTTHDVVITITGVNDAAVIAGDASGAVTEDATTPNLTDTGTLTLSDVDSGEASFLTGASDIVAAEGTLGSLAITADGVWTYSVANSAVQYLAEGETKDETFTVQAIDGTSHDVVITITGVNDAAVIAGNASGAVTEDLNVTDGNLTDTGTLTINDADSGEASFLTGASDIVAAEGTLGNLAITADGVWTYSVANSAVQYLKAGETKDATFTVQAIDGTSHDVVVTITGVNDAPIDGDETVTVCEDTPLTVAAAAGLLANFTDADGDLPSVTGFTVAGMTYPVAAQAPGVAVLAEVGTLTINSDGSYSFTPARNYTGSIPLITYTVSDGNGGTDTSTLTLSIAAVDDASVLSPDTKTVIEDNPATGNVLTNDSDADNTLSVASFTMGGTTVNAGERIELAGVGTITIAANGDYSFTPAPDWHGTVPQITYTTNTGSSSTLAITVTAIPDPVTVSSPTVNEASPYAVFTVTGVAGETLSLELAGASAKPVNDRGPVVTDGSEDFGPGFEVSPDNGATWMPYTGAVTLTGSRLLVRTAVINDNNYEVSETFTLTATSIGGKPAIGTATIRDDGTGEIYSANGKLDTTTVRDDDRPVPPPRLPAQAVIAVAPASVMLPYGDVRIDILEPPVVAAPLPPEPVRELPSLTVVNPIPAQYADKGVKSSFALPDDAFAHTDPSEVLRLSASLADGQQLPGWIQFDANSGTFQFQAPADFVGELHLKVIARDSKGNEVSTVFRFNVGQKRENGKPVGRASLSEQLRTTSRDGGFPFGKTGGQASRDPVVKKAART